MKIELKRSRSYYGITLPTKWLIFNPPSNPHGRVNPESFGTWVYRIDGVVYTTMNDAFIVALKKAGSTI